MIDIMRANVSDYIAAGNNAARQTSNIQAAAIQSGPDYSKIVKEAQNQKIKTEIAARKAAAGVVKAGMEGEARLKIAENRVKGAQASDDAKKHSRKAGAVAAAGLLVGDVISRRADKKDRKERAELPTFDYGAARKSITDEIALSRSRTEALLNPKETESTSTDSTESTKQTVAPLNIEQRALLDTIYFGEGTWKGDASKGSPMYNTAFNYNQFDNSKPHPGTVYGSAKVSSAAHGAGQFMPDTWREINDGINAPMTAANQDAAALRLATERGQYDFTKPFSDQASNLAGIWASFPTSQGRSQYNLDDGTPQPSKSLSELTNFYEARRKALMEPN